MQVLGNAIGREHARAGALALALVALLFALQHDVGLWPQDEGFLWYGAQRTALGEVPLRDFRSYDPGRYLWCAAWTPLLGDGLVGVRAAGAIFQAIGLFFGLLAARRAVGARWGLVPAGVLLVLWGFPPWKLYESAWSQIAVWALVRLLERPTLQRHVAAGAVAGLAGFFGRNLGAYAAVAGALAIGFAWLRSSREHLPSRLAAFGAGTALGLTPLLAMLLLVRGFGAAFLESIALYLRQESWNAEHAIRWPWTVDVAGQPPAVAVSIVATSLFFLIVPAIAVGLLVLAARTRGEAVAPRALALAGLAVGLPFAHHVAVRSDVYHLAQGLHPWLLGALGLAAAAPAARRARVVAATLSALLLASLTAMGPQLPIGRKWAVAGTPRAYVPLDVRGAEVWAGPHIANWIQAVRARLVANVPAGEALWISPKLLVLYPMLGRRSPVWDVYPAWTADAAMEQRMLDELSGVDWAFLTDVALGGDEEMRFANAYPLVWRRLQQDFELVPTPELAANQFLLRRP